MLCARRASCLKASTQKGELSIASAVTAQGFECLHREVPLLLARRCAPVRRQAYSPVDVHCCSLPIGPPPA